MPSNKDNGSSPFDENFDRAIGVSPLKMAAMQLHEMYTNLREAGFSKREALYLVSKMMAGPEE